jgi:hypothetical protein
MEHILTRLTIWTFRPSKAIQVLIIFYRKIFFEAGVGFEPTCAYAICFADKPNRPLRQPVIFFIKHLVNLTIMQ